jgi:hypothetical protein
MFKILCAVPIDCHWGVASSDCGRSWTASARARCQQSQKETRRETFRDRRRAAIHFETFCENADLIGSRPGDFYEIDFGKKD